MSTIGFTSFGFPLKTRNQNLPPVASAYASPSPERIDSEENGCGVLKRRTSIVSRASLVSSSILGFPKEGLAIVKQGLLAGRIPGYLNLMNKVFPLLILDTIMEYKNSTITPKSSYILNHFCYSSSSRC